MTSPRSAPSPLLVPHSHTLPALICLGDDFDDEELPSFSGLTVMVIGNIGFDPEEWVYYDNADIDPDEFDQVLLDSQGEEIDREELARHWDDVYEGMFYMPYRDWARPVIRFLTDQPDPFDLIAAEPEDEEDSRPDLEEIHIARMATNKAGSEQHWNDTPRKKRWAVDGQEGQARSTMHTQHSRTTRVRAMRQAVKEAQNAVRVLEELMTTSGDQGESPVER